MATVTYDERLRPTRTLDARDYKELCAAIIVYGSRDRRRHHQTPGLAFYRVLDILNPLNEPLAPVVSIESLAPDTEPCEECGGDGIENVRGGGAGEPEWDGERPCSYCEGSGRVQVEG